MNNQKIRSMIVEDEPEALDLLAGLLEATGEAVVVSSTTNPLEAVDLILMHNPDILFLDIKMPGMSDFDIINEMNRLTALTPHVVFTTAHDEYAIKAFDFAAFDYLLKPIDPDRLAETLHRHRSQTTGTGNAQNGQQQRKIADHRGNQQSGYESVSEQNKNNRCNCNYRICLNIICSYFDKRAEPRCLPPQYAD